MLIRPKVKARQSFSVCVRFAIPRPALIMSRTSVLTGQTGSTVSSNQRFSSIVRSGEIPRAACTDVA